MKYKIEKVDYDGRMWTRGMLLPDGYYRVVSLTRRNIEHLTGFEKRGYQLTELPDDDGTVCGLYEEGSDKLVEDQSVNDYLSDVPNAKVKYVSKEAMKTYVDPASTVGLTKLELRNLRRDSRMSKAQLESAKVRDQVNKSRESGLRDAAAQMGIKASSLGAIEDELLAKIG